MNEKDNSIELRNKIMNYFPLVFAITRVVFLLIGFIVCLSDKVLSGITYLVISVLVYYIDSVATKNLKNNLAVTMNKVTDLLFIVLLVINLLILNKKLVFILLALEIVYIGVLVMYRLKLNKWEDILTGGKVKNAFLFVTLIILIASAETDIFTYYGYGFIALTALTQVWAIGGAIKLYSMDKKTANLN